MQILTFKKTPSFISQLSTWNIRVWRFSLLVMTQSKEWQAISGGKITQSKHRAAQGLWV